VPKWLLFGSSCVRSRTKFGAALSGCVGSRSATLTPLPSRFALYGRTPRTGADRFSGPGAPSRCCAPLLVPLVSTNPKSAELVSVSFGRPPRKHGLRRLTAPPLPQVSRYQEWLMLGIMSVIGG